MGIFVVIGIAFIFATGVVTIWEKAERSIANYFERRKRRMMRDEKKRAAEKIMRDFARRQMAEEKRLRIEEKWNERTMWRNEIDCIWAKKERRLINEKL